ncbi:MAG: DegT/DnrJ/EryC1/StrS family aminotransferase [Planctomycetaceae bacterium]
MVDNITRADLDAVVRFLSGGSPILTQSVNVAAFEREWADWLGVRHCVFVNSGSSANQMTMAALRERSGPGEIIVPTLTWVSDIAAVLQAGFTPVFVDIDPRTLGMDLGQVVERITPRTKGVFLTHILGYDALTDGFLADLRRAGVPLIEDVCESHGATHAGRRLGSFGLASNFSFYYAHHLSTIEGGMVCTDDDDLYHMLRMMRSHGMVRESQSDAVKEDYKRRHPDLNPDFIFAFPAYNFRSTEINAVIGRSQLPRLDANNARRTENLHAFFDALDPARFRTDFKREGSSNYAFTLVLRDPDEALRDRVEAALRAHAVEFRRGTSGGGNQLRQPYLRRLFGDEYRRYPQVDHVHFFGWYIGNYPTLDVGRVGSLCTLLNGL